MCKLQTGNNVSLNSKNPTIMINKCYSQTQSILSSSKTPKWTWGDFACLLCAPHVKNFPKKNNKTKDASRRASDPSSSAGKGDLIKPPKWEVET